MQDLVENQMSSAAKSSFMRKLRGTKQAEIKSNDLTTLSDAESDAVSGGAIRVIIIIRSTRTDSCSGGVADDCVD